MNMKKVATGIISSAMVISMGIGAYAQTDQTVLATEAIKLTDAKQFKTALTEEQIEEIKTKHQEKLEKYNALSSAEKAELKSLTDQARKLQKEMIQKQLELELIDQNQADEMLEKIKNQEALEQENPEMLWLNMGRGLGKNMTISFENLENLENTEITKAITITQIAEEE